MQREEQPGSSWFVVSWDLWLLQGITLFCLNKHELETAQKLQSGPVLRHSALTCWFSILGASLAHVALLSSSCVCQSYRIFLDTCCNFLVLYELRLPITYKAGMVLTNNNNVILPGQIGMLQRLVCKRDVGIWLHPGAWGGGSAQQ